MRSKTLLTLIAGAALGLSAAGCDSTDNANANANANANVNATANATANARNWNMSREEYNKNESSYRAEAKNRGETIGQDLEDGWIHFKVRGELALVNDLRDSTINVDVDKKVVTLRGSVASADQKKKAEDAAKKVDGVARVVNRLEVKPDTGGNKNAGNANSNAHGAANANRKG